jgi:hypothetical protein
MVDFLDGFFKTYCKLYDVYLLNIKEEILKDQLLIK